MSFPGGSVGQSLFQVTWMVFLLWSLLLIPCRLLGFTFFHAACLVMESSFQLAHSPIDFTIYILLGREVSSESGPFQGLPEAALFTSCHKELLSRISPPLRPVV